MKHFMAEATCPECGKVTKFFICEGVDEVTFVCGKNPWKKDNDGCGKEITTKMVVVANV